MPRIEGKKEEVKTNIEVNLLFESANSKHIL